MALELLCACRALEHRRPLTAGLGSERLYGAVRRLIPAPELRPDTSTGASIPQGTWRAGQRYPPQVTETTAVRGVADQLFLQQRPDPFFRAPDHGRAGIDPTLALIVARAPFRVCLGDPPDRPPPESRRPPGAWQAEPAGEPGPPGGQGRGGPSRTARRCSGWTPLAQRSKGRPECMYIRC